MQSCTEIKGKKLGEGKPLICVPIVEQDRDGILSECRSVCETAAEMIEWRVDLFDSVNDTDAVLELLGRIADMAGEKILLFTYRSMQQGGGGTMAPRDIEAMLERVAEKGKADIIDIEHFMSPDPKKLVKRLHALNTVVLASHHDFEETPKVEAMMGLLSTMALSGADIVKLAVMPHNMGDVLKLLDVTERFRQEFPEKPMITMSMGKYGMLSRLCGEFFGIAVTFGAHSRASAPGQLDLYTLTGLLEKIHASFGEA